MSSQDSWCKKNERAIWIILFLLTIIALVVIVILTFALKLNCACNNSCTKETETTNENLKFFLVSDFHLDPFYKVNISATDACRPKVNGTAASFEAPYGRIGCDSPSTLLSSLFTAMKKEEASFLLFIGDLAAHDLWKADGNAQDVLTTIAQATDLTHHAFPDIPIFLLFGNNDVPGHYALPNETSTWYKNVLDKWAPLILCSDCSKKIPRPTDMETLNATFLKGGYYNASIAGGQAVLLVLNSMYWATKSSKGEYIQGLAQEQMNWLKQQLQLAKSRGQKAFLASHIPPGIDTHNEKQFWWPNYTQKYVDLVSKEYSEIVAGQFYGHAHRDDFQLLMPQDNVSSRTFTLLSPSISPIYKNNPGFRVVSYDTDNKALLDYKQYYMDIVMATEFSRPVWQLDYSFRQKYPSANRFIDAQRIYNLNEQLINQTSNGFWDNYIESRQTHYHPDDKSRFLLYCAMRYVYKEDYQKCRNKYQVSGG